MKKVKEWFKKHKKEIIVGVAAAGCTALYFLIKQKKVKIEAGLTVRLGFLDEIDDAEEYRYKNNIYSSINLNNPDLSLEDLGKLGDIIKSRFPAINAQTKLDHVFANYAERV